ncbi:MAG TPA: SGNH/GDSL hydrolase family protein [Roseiarcus sp.]|jgi:phospholipase/lecithinase/hemolysin
MNRKLCLTAFVVALACASTPAAAAYTSIFAFGDSLSDAGNLSSESGGKIPSKPYVDGHFSNGPTWVEDLYQMLGLGAMKPFLTSADGTNFAFGGAQTGITDINPFDPSSPVHIDLPDQISAFNLVDPNPVKGALYTIDIGANDIMNALEDKIPPSELQTVMMQAEANTIASVKSLVGLGARSLLFYEVPNLGLTPRFRGTALQGTASDLAASFNAVVLNGLAGFKSEGLKVFTLDTYDLLGEIEADPSHFGFTNVSDPCWTGSFTDPSSGTLCSPNLADQNQYLFWDEVHPTAAGHLLTAEFAVEALAAPEISTWAMMLVGFAGLGFAGYRRSRERATA